MKRRFVIGVDGLDPDEERQFREYLSSFGYWWHWIGNMWLLTTSADTPTAEQIRDRILELNGNVRTVVFEFPEDLDWAASGTVNAKGRAMSEWLTKHWGEE